ncbi:Hypothetical protein NTJ_00117 [Nesidiocoris tenuis]|uniref:Uncharacterized protein n=1 Tax=Nesidiocoris tenuis TaxID=355587 RepID=A0ABN7A550_9HEMI|nr:Hypothetical protein NTJ_00117 [Nesidiocoris tenuis]
MSKCKISLIPTDDCGQQSRGNRYVFQTRKRTAPVRSAASDRNRYAPAVERYHCPPRTFAYVRERENDDDLTRHCTEKMSRRYGSCHCRANSFRYSVGANKVLLRS